MATAANSGSYYNFDEPTEAGKRRSRIAEALIGQGTSTAPVGHWTQAVARALQGAMGGYALHQAEQRDEAARRQRSDMDQQTVNALLGVLGPQPQQSQTLDPVAAALTGQESGPSADVHDPDMVRPPTPVSPTGEAGVFEGAPGGRNAIIAAEPAGHGFQPVQPMGGGGLPMQTGGVSPQPERHALDPVTAALAGQEAGPQPQMMGPHPQPMGRPQMPAPAPAQAQRTAGLQVDPATRQYLETLIRNPQTRAQGVAMLNAFMQERRKANAPLSPIQQAQLRKSNLEIEKLELEKQAKAREGEKVDNLGQNISGGLDQLARVSSEFSPWTFEAATGTYQGDPNSYVGSLLRGWGSLINTGRDRHTSEVRNRIAGDTEALAAAIKPLIRAPGEGPWTDKDQERLVAVVGNLAQANDEGEYHRALEGVRQRVKANFNIDLPPINFPERQLGGSGRPRAQHPQTGEVVEFDGQQWRPVK